MRSKWPEGFIVAPRTGDGIALIESNKNAFVLLFVIAMRARRSVGAGFNPHNLNPGEALLGDHRKYDMTEQEYRTAKDLLKRHGLATFRSTTKGSIATLMNSRVFDINQTEGNGQINGNPTPSQRTANGRVTTNEECKKVKNGNQSAGGELLLDPDQKRIPNQNGHSNRNRTPSN